MNLPPFKLRLIRTGSESATDDSLPAGEASPAGVVRSETASDAIARSALIEKLFNEHRAALLQYLTRLLSSADDAEEVLQETYVRLLRLEHLDHLDDQVRRFLFKIATNLARDRFRLRKTHSASSHVPYELVEIAGEEETPAEIVDWNAGMQVIKQVLLDLPPRHRQVFLLHVTQNMSYRNIAKHLNVSAKTVERDIAMVLELCQGRLRTADKP